MLSKEKFQELVDELSKCSDMELVEKFIVVDGVVNQLWENVDDYTSDLRYLVSEIMLERFVRSHSNYVFENGKWTISGVA